MSLRSGSGSAMGSGSGTATGSHSPTGVGSPARKKTYKNIPDGDKGKKKREDEITGIRKVKREEYLLKKRREAHTTQSRDKFLEDIPENAQKLWSENTDEELAATMNFGSLLELENPPIEEIVTAGVVPRFVEFLSREDTPRLQLESICVLTNLASGASQFTAVLVEHDVIPPLVNLLSCTDDDIREQTVGALGNIAGDSVNNRDLILIHGALLPLLSQLEPDSRLSMLRQASWCLSNLLRGKPSVDLEEVRPALPVLQLLVHFDDEEVVKNTCWALCYIVEGPYNSVQAVLELGVCPKLVELLHHPSGKVTLPALQALGNIAAGDDVQTQVVLDSRVLPSLHQLLMKEYKRRIFREICWVITNISGGTPSQIQAVVDANVVPFLVELLYIADFEVKKSAAWVIGNVSGKGTKENVRYLADQGCIKGLCELLPSPDLKLVLMCLEALENFLKMGKDDQSEDNVFVAKVKECEGVYEKIHNVLASGNRDITKVAWRLCERIWNENEPDSD
ncbi:importin subunit alpha-1a-like [Vigna radiata var. radiata]|uniref:Importin subunit alpha n=1 Tax=Vigna radiata var. radiata TaxID=3916 RepID=A0A3Q0EX91_VIGRR|nr:importin subunit alpha-1a-like [Vigna radiata var. radiata]